MYFKNGLDKIRLKILVKMCEIWQSLTLYISLFSTKQQCTVVKMSEFNRGSLKASKLTKTKVGYNLHLRLNNIKTQLKLFCAMWNEIN